MDVRKDAHKLKVSLMDLLLDHSHGDEEFGDLRESVPHLTAYLIAKTYYNDSQNDYCLLYPNDENYSTKEARWWNECYGEDDDECEICSDEDAEEESSSSEVFDEPERLLGEFFLKGVKDLKEITYSDKVDFSLFKRMSSRLNYYDLVTLVSGCELGNGPKLLPLYQEVDPNLFESYRIQMAKKTENETKTPLGITDGLFGAFVGSAMAGGGLTHLLSVHSPALLLSLNLATSAITFTGMAAVSKKESERKRTSILAEGDPDLAEKTLLNVAFASAILDRVPQLWQLCEALEDEEGEVRNSLVKKVDEIVTREWMVLDSELVAAMEEVTAKEEEARRRNAEVKDSIVKERVDEVLATVFGKD